MASKRVTSRSSFNKRRMTNESSDESDTELIQFSDQLVATTVVDDSQGPARGVSSSGPSDFVTCAFSADLRLPTSLDVDLPPERFFTVDGEQYIIPDPERPFSQWITDAGNSSSSTSMIPSVRRFRGSVPSSSLPSSSSAEPALSGEWRYTLPPNPVVSTPQAAAPLPDAPPPVGIAPAFVAANPPGVPADFDLFPGPTNGTTIVPAYLELVFPSAPNLRSRRFDRQWYEQLAVGQCICVMGFRSEEVSWANTVGPVVIYLVVHKLQDGSVDATRAYVESAALAASHPQWITFFPEVGEEANLQNSVIILNQSTINMRAFPFSLGTVAVEHQVQLLGSVAHALPRLAAEPCLSQAGPMLYDTTDSHLKRETREEKLVPFFVAMRGDASAVAAFVGSARDLAQESVLSKVHQNLSVAQAQLPCFRPEVLPIVLQCQFGPTYQTVNKRGINITAQHFMPPYKPNNAFQFGSVTQMVDCIQNFNESLSRLFVFPGSPLHTFDPLFMYGVTLTAVNQLRSTTNQDEYLPSVPVNCVVQRLNQAFADFGKFMRIRDNALIPIEEFRSKLSKIFDLHPGDCVRGALTAVNNAGLFIPPQFATFDGTSLPTSNSSGAPVSGVKRPFLGPYPPAAGRLPKNPRYQVPAPVRNTAPLRHQPAPAVIVGPLPNNRGQYICVSDFVTKLDGTRYPQGCTTTACSRRHIPLPPIGQFAAADKQEILQSLSRMKGTKVASMVALVQSRQ